jgi:hypothetical protein
VDEKGRAGEKDKGVPEMPYPTELLLFQHWDATETADQERVLGMICLHSNESCFICGSL